MDNIFSFPHPEDIGIHRKAAPGESGLPHVLKSFQEFRELVDTGEVEFFILVGGTKDDKRFGFIAGIFDPINAAGMLEHVKIQVIAP